jgi:virginiamycin A acetyltransferase
MRALTRDSVTLLFVLLTAPLWVAVKLIGFGGREVGLFATLGQALSLIPGFIGSFTRRAYYLMTLEVCAKDIGVGFGTWFSKRRVRISPRVSLGAHCLIGSCTIGEGTLLGSNIDVLSGRHQHSMDGLRRQRAENSNSFSQVHIGENVWVGNRTIIMADIGDNSVIGAGAVVVHSIPRDSVAVGNPAIVKKPLDRTIAHTKECLTRPASVSATQANPSFVPRTS